MASRFLRFLVVMLFFSACSSKKGKKEYTNFVLIFADDLGYGDLSCYGHPTIMTPNIDKLANEGLKMTQFYSVASVCTPSRAGLLTGQYPIRNGLCGSRYVFFPDSGLGLQDSVHTIAEVLKEEGYATACYGKWHLGHLPEYLPTNHGFDHYFGIPYSNDMAPELTKWEYAKNFPPTPLIQQDSVLELDPDQRILTKQYTERSIDFIKENNEKPFFLYLPHTFPHVPLFVDDANSEKSKRGKYGDVVEVLDWSVGEIMKTLQEQGLEDNTLVIFTSDNGPWDTQRYDGGSAGLFRGAKSSSWEGGYRVPSIWKLPSLIKPGSVSDEMVSSLDIFPTMAALADIEFKHSIDGLDIHPLIQDDLSVRDEFFYYKNEVFKAVRKGPWKLHFKAPHIYMEAEEMPMLYNVEEDPSERFNVANEHPSIVTNLMELAEMHRNSIVPVESRLDSILPEYRAGYDAFFGE